MSAAGRGGRHTLVELVTAKSWGSVLLKSIDVTEANSFTTTGNYKQQKALNSTVKIKRKELGEGKSRGDLRKGRLNLEVPPIS